MAARLGNVLYWLGCIVAVVIAVALALWLVPAAERNGWGLRDWAFIAATILLGALIPWAIGRACRYVLAGR